MEINFATFYEGQQNYHEIFSVLDKAGYRMARFYSHRAHDEWLWWADLMFIENSTMSVNKYTQRLFRPAMRPVVRWLLFISSTTANSGNAGNCGHSVRFVAERKRVSGSGCVIDTATAQASAPLLWGAGAELAVAGTGDGVCWAEAGGGAQAPAAKGSGCRQRCSAERTPGAISVGAVAGAHLRGVCAQVQRVRRTVGLIGFITEPATVRQILAYVGEPTSAPANALELVVPEAVEIIPELEFDQTVGW